MISRFEKYDLHTVLIIIIQIPVYQSIGVDYFHSQDKLDSNEQNCLCAEFSSTQVEKVLNTIIIGLGFATYVSHPYSYMVHRCSKTSIT